MPHNRLNKAWVFLFPGQLECSRHSGRDLLPHRRLQSGQTGAVWQKKWVERYGPRWQELTLSYAEHQRSGEPVHSWGL